MRPPAGTVVAAPVAGRSASGPEWGSGVFAATLGLAIVLRIGIVLNRAFDPDESQHLHAAWLVSQGRVPFRDFWEHHTPLLYYGLAPLTRWFAESPTVYLAGRTVMTGLAVLALVLTYQLARRLSRAVAPVAVALLALLPEFAEDTTETRPDVPALVAWLVTLLAVLRWRERDSPGWLWVAGLAQGLALAFTLKAAYGALGVGLAMTVAVLAEGPGRWRRLAGALGRFAGGAVIPLVALLSWLAWSGGWLTLRRFVDGAVIQNLRFVDFTKTWPIPKSGEGLLALALVGVGLAVWRHGSRIVIHPVHGMLLIPITTIAVLLALPSTPAVYHQAWLPLLPVFAVYAAWALVTVAAWARGRGGWGRWSLVALAVVVGAVVPVGETIHDALQDEAAEQVRLMRLMLRDACPGEPVLDGRALYVFRPAAYRYRVLMTGVREWVARGMVSEEAIAAEMKEARAPVAYVDRRVRGMIGAIDQFLSRYYAPSGDGVLLAGASITVPGAANGGRTYVDLLRSGPYRFTAEPGIEVAVDRALLRRGWVELRAGRHEVTWVGPPGTIRFVAATCPERQAIVSNRLTVPHGGY